MLLECYNRHNNKGKISNHLPLGSLIHTTGLVYRLFNTFSGDGDANMESLGKKGDLF